MPYFAVGYAFPFHLVAKSTDMLGMTHPAHRTLKVLVALFVGLYCFWFLPTIVPPLPDAHGAFNSGEAGKLFTSMSTLEHSVYWVRRLAKVALTLMPSFSVLFIVLPRSETFFTWMGPHILYPYVWHEVAIYWRNQLVLAVKPPIITSSLGHCGVLLLHVGFVGSVLALFSSSLWRALWDWCFKPSWVDILLLSIDEKNENTGKGVLQLDMSKESKESKESKVSKVSKEADQIKDEAGNTARKEPETVRSLAQMSTEAGTTPRDNLGELDAGSPHGSIVLPHKNPQQCAPRPLPWLKEGKQFYKYMLPCTLLGHLFCLILSFVMYRMLLLPMLITLPQQTFLIVLVICASMNMIGHAVVIVYNMNRLQGTIELPQPRLQEEGRGFQGPMFHVVVIVAYKEPVDVLCRTYDSIASQQGLGQKIQVVLAVEQRDPTWPEAHEALRRRDQGCVAQLKVAQHVLVDGEAAGKSSNENSAVRQIYADLVDNGDFDPFNVMVTIVDADSILSKTYLAHTEASFFEQPDGRRLIYSGPLNTYRNFGDGSFLVQQYELQRSNLDVFHDPSAIYHAQSNYSLTLGLCHEIGFWTPDCMPEDVHTSTKARLLTFGGMTTVMTPPLICNDLVTDLGDRYIQAKRHCWGSIELLAWHLGAAIKLRMSVPHIFTNLLFEVTRQGSLITTMLQLNGWISFLAIGADLRLNQWDQVSHFRILALLFSIIAVQVWIMIWFWIGEWFVWSHLMKQFDYKPASTLRWFLLVLTSPVCHCLTSLLWTWIPMFDCLFHMTFIGELAYICAPKA